MFVSSSVVVTSSLICSPRCKMQFWCLFSCVAIIIIAHSPVAYHLLHFTQKVSEPFLVLPHGMLWEEKRAWKRGHNAHYFPTGNVIIVAKRVNSCPLLMYPPQRHIRDKWFYLVQIIVVWFSMHFVWFTLHQWCKMNVELYNTILCGILSCRLMIISFLPLI